MSDFNTIAGEFVRFYYQTFASNRSQLANLYQNESVLTFEGSVFQGVQAISEKYSSLPAFKLEPQVDSMDAQISSSSHGSILICITGILAIDDESRTQRFCQIFNLYPNGSGSYFVFNDMFRLNYG